MNKKNDILIEVEGLSKKFCKDLKTSLWYGVKDLSANIFGNKQPQGLRDKEFWAVKDINFTLRRGECLGLIGHNGAGKSTLLKILNGLINPDEGKVTIRGKVGALIELGAGFNPILSGRENIYNNGAILGFTKAEIDAKVEEIIDFSEIREFIDMPVQNYSSGMKVRLGFAVAVQMEPDVLIIDEVLAVGDVGFRIKCFNKISKLLQKCAVIIVSHSMPQIAKTVTLGLLMENGKQCILTSNVAKVIEMYNNKFDASAVSKVVKGVNLSKMIFNDVNLMEEKNMGKINFGCNIISKMIFTIGKGVVTEKSYYNVIFIIHDKELKPIATTSSDIFELNTISKEIEINLKIPNVRLFPSQYTISVSFNKIINVANHQRENLFYGQNIGRFSIENGPLTINHAVLIIDSIWSTKNI